MDLNVSRARHCLGCAGFNLMGDALREWFDPLLNRARNVGSRLGCAIGLYGTLLGLMLAHALLGLPFVVTVVAANLRTLGHEYEEAAMDLGANPVTTFFRIVVPLIRPGLVVGALFAFVVSFDQVDVSIFLVRPASNTLPVEMFNYAGNYQDPTLSAISALMIAVTGPLVGIGGLLLRTQEYRRFLERRSEYSMPLRLTFARSE